MHVQNGILNNMLKNIADPRLRETYGAIIAGKFPFHVYCMTPKSKRHKPGVLIGYVDNKGRAIEETVQGKDGDPVSGIATSRDRLDGRKGFSCWCGNSSIVAAEEQGVIVPRHVPTQEDLLTIHGRLQQSKKGDLQFVNGKVEYDGFMIEEVRS